MSRLTFSVAVAVISEVKAVKPNMHVNESRFAGCEGYELEWEREDKLFARAPDADSRDGNHGPIEIRNAPHPQQLSEVYSKSSTRTKRLLDVEP